MALVAACDPAQPNKSNQHHGFMLALFHIPSSSMGVTLQAACNRGC